MRGPPLGVGGQDITWPDQVAPRSRKVYSIRNLKPENSNLTSRVGSGVGTLLVDPGAVVAWSEVVCGPGVRALRAGGTRRIAPGPRHAPP